jgi:O-antigen ligase
LRLERAQLGLAAALAAVVPVSIFAAEAALALSVGVLLARIARRQANLPRTAVDAPLLAFAVWSLLSASFAADPAVSYADAKKLVLFLLFYLAVDVARRGEARERLLDALLLGGLALAAYTVAQHHLLGFDRLDRRPHGFIGHYMSAAGVTMGVLVVAAARLVGRAAPRPRWRDAWLAAAVLAGVLGVTLAAAQGRGTLAARAFVAALAVVAAAAALSRGDGARRAGAVVTLAAVPFAAWALVVSQTRGAWLGALLGLATVAALRAPRLIAAVAAAVLVLLVARPALVRERLTVSDASSVDRYYMWQAGVDMVIDRPVFGLGPGMVLSAYPRYRWPEAPNKEAPHLHDNVLQIAAERGLPALAFFLWWIAATLAAAYGEAKRRPGASPGGEGAAEAAAATAALGVVVAAFVEGLVEYNLGDSEVLMLFLLVTALPFALRAARGTPPPAPAA